MSTSPPSPTIPPLSAPPLFDWLTERAVGVLLHPTSLPGSQGIGVFDASAATFLEFLAEAGFSYWQLCPLGPTGYGDSPYQCFSSFAGNPYLIDLAALVAAGLLAETDLAPLRALGPDRVDFGALYDRKRPLLVAAYRAWRKNPTAASLYGDFAEFRSRHAQWLEAYALFTALKEKFGGRAWWEWPADVRSFARAGKSPVRAQLGAATECCVFAQYLFFGQWMRLRAQAAKLGINIIGDVPIFTALDSADVWANPGLFQLDPATCRPTAVAGVPPDYFSADGQLWGNPLYAWPAHAAEGYRWWLDRLRANFALYDVVRIDHFRGFDAYWSVPADAPTARTGRWVNGPGLDFFRAIHAALPGAKLIAEDLGLLTPATRALRQATGLPAMSVLQFAFGGAADNLYLPHNHRANSVVYPGTHDNDTTLGWYAAADEKTRDHIRRYLRISGQEIGWDFIRVAYASVSNLAIVSLPDLLSLGSEARFNTPGQSQGNWTWRYRSEQLRDLRERSSGYLREIAALYGRDGADKAAKR